MAPGLLIYSRYAQSLMMLSCITTYTYTIKGEHEYNFPIRTETSLRHETACFSNCALVKMLVYSETVKEVKDIYQPIINNNTIYF